MGVGSGTVGVGMGPMGGTPLTMGVGKGVGSGGTEAVGMGVGLGDGSGELAGGGVGASNGGVVQAVSKRIRASFLNKTNDLFILQTHIDYKSSLMCKRGRWRGCQPPHQIYILEVKQG